MVVLFVVCLVGTGVNVAIDVIYGTPPSLADWLQGGLAGLGLYLVGLGLVHATIRGNLTEINRTLAGGDTNLQTSPIPPGPRRKRKPTPDTNWKDKPLAVAATAVAGTIIFMVTAVTPILDKEKDNQIAELKAEPTKLKNEVGDLRGQLDRMELENVKLRRDLDPLSPDNLFSLDDAYPKEFRSVRIGDRIDMLKKVYGTEAATMEDEGSWVSVDFKKPQLFSRITYYYDENARLKTVTSILFHFDNQDGRVFELLKQQLIDKYGSSKMKEVKSGWRHQIEFQWSGINKHTVKLGNGTLYIDRPD